MKSIVFAITLLLSFSLLGYKGLAPGNPNVNKLATKSVTVKGVTVDVPTTWNQSDTNKTLWTDGLGNSVNIISENAGNMTIDNYVKLSIKNMKKMLPSYKVISFKDGKAKNVKYTVYLGEYALKDIGASGGSIKLYSVFVHTKGVKYVVTVGGPPEYFSKKDSVFKNIINSISLDLNYKEVVDNTGGLKTIDSKVSLVVPNSWMKQDGRDMWIDPVTRSSVNVVKENAATYNLNSYLDLSLTNMKKMITSYKLIKKSTKKVNGNTIGILEGEFTMSNMKLQLYSVVLDVNGMKYVFSIGGPKKDFKSLNKTFNKIINSIKKL